ncbi:unknown [Alistipes sp. CAG:53]|nr:unknown [Alistipes sp. CAG:53]
MQRQFFGQRGLFEPCRVLHLRKHPFQRCALQLLRDGNGLRTARRVAVHVREVDAAHVEHHGVHVARELSGRGLVKLRADFQVGVLLVGDPLLHVREDVFEVADAVVAGLDVVVAEVLLDGGGVVAGDHLLAAVTVDRVADLLVDPSADGLLLVEHVLLVGQRRVGVFDDVVVIGSEVRRGEFHALVARLGHVVETRVVHDRGGRAVLLRERCAAERIHGEGARCGHVVHQSEAVSHLVGEDVLQRLLEYVVGQLLAAHALVDLCGLHETPVGGQLHHVVVHQHRGVDDLARAGVDPRGSHGVGHGGRDVADAGVFQVVGIEFGIVLREVLDVHDVFESDLLEGLVPAQHAATDRFAPQRGERVVEVEDDRLDRLHEFAAFPGLQVFGLDVPAVDDREILDLVLLAVDARHVGQEDADARIGQAGPHRLFGQQQDRARDLHGHRLVLLDDHQAQQVGRHRVGEIGFDGHVVLEGLDLVDHRTFGLELARDVHHAALGAFDRGEQFVVAREELGHFDHHCRAVAVVADQRVGVHDRREGAPADGLGHVGIVRVVNGRHDGLREVDRRVDARELDVDGVRGFVADGPEVGVAGLRDRGGDQHFTADRLEGDLHVELSLELVERQERPFGGEARFVVDEHFGVLVDFGFGDLLGFRFFLFGFRGRRPRRRGDQ